MKLLKKTIFLTLAFGMSLFALSIGAAKPTSAASEEQSAANYVYTAQSGDSYTELARASIIRYDLDTEDIDLNAAQVTAAETWVTQDAGSPAIDIGQEILVSKESVQKYAEKAASLSDEAKSRWQTYADKGSITNGQLKDKVRETVSEVAVKTAAIKKAAEQKSKNEAGEQEEKKDDKKSSRRWVIIAIIVLLALAAVTLIRSSSQKDE